MRYLTSAAAKSLDRSLKSGLVSIAFLQQEIVANHLAQRLEDALRSLFLPVSPVEVVAGPESAVALLEIHRARLSHRCGAIAARTQDNRPTMPRPWIVTPHRPLEKLDDNLWALDADMPNKAPFNRRMAIARLA